MSIRKVLCAAARSIVGAVLRRVARACSGFGLSISVHLSVCVSIAIGVALSAGIAQAAIPSLPPLPAYLPLDDTPAQSDARY
ncbi:MAG: type IV pilus secretin PilQ, partial [Paraburkholderia graminis]